MKILQLCHRIPFPPVDGGNIAMYNLSQSLLAQGNEVKMAALNTLKHFTAPESLPLQFKNNLRLETVTVDTSVKAMAAFFNLFSNKSYNITRFYHSAFDKLLETILLKENFDVVQLESLFMMPYLSCIRKNSSAKVVLRAHNVEHIIWERLHHSEKNSLKRWYLGMLVKRLKEYELQQMNAPDAILPITREDETFFRNLGCNIPMHVTPLGIHPDDYKIIPGQPAELCLFHLGSMDWLPNLEAVDWFLKNCWGMIHNQFPSLKLYLAGRGFPKNVAEAGYPNVICEEEISDSNRYMSDKQIMIVPLLSGSGMRVKIIQGMAMGKTIISTTIGAEGIQYTEEENIIIADTPQQFFDVVKKCVADETYTKQIGRQARKLVEEKYSNEAIGKAVNGFYKKLIGA